MRGTVLVTGGTGGLGQAVVRTLLDDDYQVVASWISAAAREQLEQEIGSSPNLQLVEADATRPESVERLVQEAVACGRLEAVVNLIGGYSGGTRLHESELDSFEKMVQLNLKTTYLVSRAVLPALVANGGGSIVAVSAKAAVEPFAGAAAYTATKAAVLALIKALAVEYRSDGIRANAVLPSVIDTQQNREAMPKSDHSRWVPPLEIAAVIKFLCSPESAPISGAAIPVYGQAG